MNRLLIMLSILSLLIWAYIEADERANYERHEIDFTLLVVPALLLIGFIINTSIKWQTKN